MPRHGRHGHTGERVDEAHYRSSPTDYAIYLSHIATYDFARDLVAGGRVLDFGCGTGYGTLRLAPACTEIVGVDVSAEAISVASERYGADNLSFQQIETALDSVIPFDAASFDAVLSFQVIEHVEQPDSYLREVGRVLRPGGVVIVATPDRRTRLARRQRPWNRFHATEYDPASLQALLEVQFQHVDLLTMSAEPEILDRELRRTGRRRRLAYPFTFPGAPEAWRQLGLRAIKATGEMRLRKRVRTSDAVAFDFDESAITIIPGTAPGLNIIAVGRRS